MFINKNPKLLSLLNDIFTSGTNGILGIEITRKLMLTNIIYIIGIFLLIPYSFYSFFSNNITLGVTDILTATILIILAIHLRISNNLKFAMHSGIYLMSLLYIYLATGITPGNAGHLWSLTQPLFTLFLLGTFYGSIVTSIFGVIIIFVMLLPYEGKPDIYTFDFIIRYVGTYIAIYVIALFFENLRQRTQAIISKQTQEVNVSKERLQDILLSSSDIIWETDSNGICVYISETVRYVFDMAPQKFIGEKILNPLKINCNNKLQEIIKNACSKKETIANITTQCQTSKGDKIILKTSGVPVIGKNNITVGYRGVSKDITLQQKTKQEKEILQEQLNQAQKLESIGRLAGGIAHDFNNILGAISGYAQMIHNRTKNYDPKLSKYSKTIMTASQRATKLTSGLLAFARKGNLVITEVSIHNSISKSIELMKHSINKNIKIIQNFEAEKHIISGDSAQLENVFINLALNAQDAMQNGGTLTFSTQNVTIKENLQENNSLSVKQGFYIRIDIIDTGIGMNNATKEKAFEPFFTTKEQGKGTGLGLASVYGIVQSHKGYITLETSLEKGTKFHLYFPVSTTTKNIDFEDTKRINIRKGNETILVIDDEEMIREMASDLFKDSGYLVHCCKNGKEGVNFYRSHKNEVNLIILDLIMPVMSGIECFYQLREINNQAKILIASGFTADETIGKLCENKYTGFIKKPFEISTIFNNIREILEQN